MTDPSPTDRLAVPEPPPPMTPPVVAAPPATTPSPPPSTPPGTAWAPPRSDGGRTGAIVFGLILLAVGLWFFADRTLGLAMPDIEWGQLWPLILIALGGWLVIGSLRRR